MKFKKPRQVGTQPETKYVIDPLIKLLRAKGWYVKNIHGSKYQTGLPDLYATHIIYGERWIEGKYKKGILSGRQIKEFTLMSNAGAKIYVLRDPSEYHLLFGTPNWRACGTRIYSPRVRIHHPPKGF